MSLLTKHVIASTSSKNFWAKDYWKQQKKFLFSGTVELNNKKKENEIMFGDVSLILHCFSASSGLQMYWV